MWKCTVAFLNRQWSKTGKKDGRGRENGPTTLRVLYRAHGEIGLDPVRGEWKTNRQGRQVDCLADIFGDVPNVDLVLEEKEDGEKGGRGYPKRAKSSRA